MQFLILIDFSLLSLRLRTFWICGLVSFITLGKVLCLFLQILLLPYSVIPLILRFQWQHVTPCHHILCLSFSFPYFINFSFVIFFVDLTSNLQIFSSVLSNMLFKPSIENFILVIFPVLKFFFDFYWLSFVLFCLKAPTHQPQLF